EAKVRETDFAAEVMITLRMLEGTQDPLITKLTELTRGQTELIISEPFDAPF
ncbi:MAG: DUF1949 domain-containing protein, partial [Eggerthellaceae bacterium]|nr:DUF1949 domain-containing protein [Eggerthellaceae bacterium]